jgi:hemerythrin HHE cation binding domain-containing protein
VQQRLQEQRQRDLASARRVRRRSRELEVRRAGKICSGLQTLHGRRAALAKTTGASAGGRRPGRITTASEVIGDLLTKDHRRLEGLLDAAFARPDAADLATYAAFRAGLLRHIGIEEKVLLPAAQAASGAPLVVATRLRLDHGAIAALLVPTPTREIVATLRDILARHNVVEEGPDGLYATCDAVLAPQAAALVAEMAAYPEVRVSAHNDAPVVMPAVVRALERAGYRLLPPD